MKKLIGFILSLVCVLAMAGCNNKSMDYIIENKPSVTGIVEEVRDDYIIMYSDSAEGYPNGSRWSIFLDVENKDSYTDLVVGDEIVVYHDGNVMESDPLQVGTVYAITLKTPAERVDKENLSLIPKGKEPKMHALKESDRAILFADLGGIISVELADKIWEMIWKRWNYYEAFCNQR